MYLLEPIENWASFMMEPLEARIMLSAAIPALAVEDDTTAYDAGNGAVLLASQTRGETALMIVRLRPDGSPDAGFGGDGIVYLGAAGYADAVRTQPDGKILLLTSGANPWVTLYRLNADGSADRSFGSAGRVALASDPDGGGHLTLSPDGRITVTKVGGDSIVSVWRLTADGRLDPTFAGGHGVRFRPAVPVSFVAGATPAASGEFDLTLGHYASGGAFARIAPDGAIERSFGWRGPADSPSDYPLTRNVLPDGRTIIVGEDEVDQDLLLFRRYNANGHLDRTFGDGGTARISHPGWSFPTEPPVGLPDGRTAIGIFTFSGGTDVLVLDRDGRPDPAFGDDGWLTAQPGSAPAAAFARWMVLVPTADGGMLETHYLAADVAGVPYGAAQLVVQPFDSAGRPVATFGTGGRVTLDIDPSIVPVFDQADGPPAFPEEPAAPPAAENPDKPEVDNLDAAGATPIAGGGAPTRSVFSPVQIPDDGRPFLLGTTPRRSLLGQFEEDVLLS
jgi:uncharacterized delta-60 repeat protein